MKPPPTHVDSVTAHNFSCISILMTHFVGALTFFKTISKAVKLLHTFPEIKIIQINYQFRCEKYLAIERLKAFRHR